MNFVDIKIFKINFYKRLFQILGIDSSVGWSIFNNIWGILRGFIGLYFLLRYLSIEEQGIWYTFISLGFLTSFADLGFTIIITQFVSHEYSKLTYNQGLVHGNDYDLDKFFSLIRFSLKVYLFITPLAVIILAVAGFWFFSSQSLVILIAWFVFSIIGGFSLFGSLLQSIYQGLDKVKDIQQNIFIGSFFTSAFNWTLLYFRFNIWALVIGNAFGLLVMLIILFKKAPLFWKQLYHYKIINKFYWIKELISLQWKYAISWISGYFIFNLFVPAVYKVQGASVAGQLGITITLIGVVSAISDSWLRTKVPKFNILVANNMNKELKKIFYKSAIQSFIAFVFGSVCLLFALILFSNFHIYPDRFLSMKLTLLLLLSNIPMKVVSYLAVFLRSHKIEPYYSLSAVNAGIIIFCVLVVYPHFGLQALILSLNIVYWIILMPFAIGIYRSFNKSQKVRLKG
jgi:O-antigen/teichoic acid export membrane protein